MVKTTQKKSPINWKAKRFAIKIKVDKIKIGNGKVGKNAHVFQNAYMEAIQLK